MFEFLRPREEKPKTERDLERLRVHTEVEAVKRAEGGSFYRNATEEEVIAELMAEAKEEDENRRAA